MPGTRGWRSAPGSRLAADIERINASIRARVEHPFHIIKNLFGLKKVRYRGLARNTAQLYTLFGLANLMIARRCLLDPRTIAS